jgi:hypothetical protein
MGLKPHSPSKGTEARARANAGILRCAQNDKQKRAMTKIPGLRSETWGTRQGQRQKQIPFGNDKQKSKDNYGDSGCARMTTSDGCARMTDKKWMLSVACEAEKRRS